MVHQLFGAPDGKKSWQYQLNAKIAASRDTRPKLLLRHNVTSFDARWKTDSRVDQHEQRTEESECTSNTLQTYESLLHYAVTLRQNAQAWTRPYMVHDTEEVSHLIIKSAVLMACKSVIIIHGNV